MTDIISSETTEKPARRAATSSAPPVSHGDMVAVSHGDMVALVELFFFAYRDFTGESDAVLAEFGLGRAHHRVLHFVNRRPGLRVADLLDILKVTKQSLARVLKRMVEDGWIEQVAGTDDRRERRLSTTERGGALAGRLATLQADRMAEALAAAKVGAAKIGAGDAVEAFLVQMIRADERDQVARLVRDPRQTNQGD